jgi:hypothetical protein
LSAIISTEHISCIHTQCATISAVLSSSDVTALFAVKEKEQIEVISEWGN